MPVHIEQLTSDVTAVAGELPLSERQIEKLVALVCARIEEKRRAEEQAQAERSLTSSTAPSLTVED